MCDVFELHESYYVSELVRQLGALYDKEREKSMDDGRIKQERRHVSLRLMEMAIRLESKRHNEFDEVDGDVI